MNISVLPLTLLCYTTGPQIVTLAGFAVLFGHLGLTSYLLLIFTCEQTFIILLRLEKPVLGMGMYVEENYQLFTSTMVATIPFLYCIKCDLYAGMTLCLIFFNAMFNI